MDDNKPPSRLLCDKEVADILGVTPGTIRNQRLASFTGPRIPYIRLNRTIRYRPEAVRTFIIEQETNGR